MKKSKFIVGLLLMTLALSILLTASFKEAPAQELPKRWTIGVLSPGTSLYAIGSSFAKVITNKTPIFCIVVPYASTTKANLAMLEKKVDMTTFHSIGAWMMAQGIGLPDKKPAYFVRVAQAGAPLQFAPLVRKNSGMVSVKDMKGKRVARMATPMQRLEIDFAMADAGLTWGDVTEVPCADVGESVKLLIDGTVDVANHALGASDVVKAEAAISGGVRHLSFDPTPKALAIAMEKVAPFTVGLRKAGFSTGIVEDTYVEDTALYLATYPGAPDQAVYVVVKALYENYKELAPAHPLLREWTPDKFVQTLGLAAPYHPGAIKFYKEVGLWKDEAQKAQEKILREWHQEK
jgi:TRAP transporter TAXI family solute receptor